MAIAVFNAVPLMSNALSRRRGIVVLMLAALLPLESIDSRLVIFGVVVIQLINSTLLVALRVSALPLLAIRTRRHGPSTLLSKLLNGITAWVSLNTSQVIAVEFPFCGETTLPWPSSTRTWVSVAPPSADLVCKLLKPKPYTVSGCARSKIWLSAEVPVTTARPV